MKKIKKQFVLTEFTSLNELQKSDASLVKSAAAAAQSAYAPYSKYKVGAAVRLANGKIILGSNQENAAYPSGLCAERVALFSAGAAYPGVSVEAIAVNVKPSGKSSGPVAPCGACRQVMAEYEAISKTKMKVIMSGTTAKILSVNSVGDLLPLAFGKANL